MQYGKLIFDFTCTNDSSRFVLVGNCSDFISDHATIEDAQAALAKVRIGESKWSHVYILAPGETRRSSELEKHLYAAQKFSEDDFAL